MSHHARSLRFARRALPQSFLVTCPNCERLYFSTYPEPTPTCFNCRPHSEQLNLFPRTPLRLDEFSGGI